MGLVLRLNSEKFLLNFLKEFDSKEFQFVLVSENIRTDKRYKNVKALPSLIPPPNAIREYINGDSNEYKRKYIEYLKSDEINSVISIIVKAAVVDGLKMVLLCSKSEDEYKYLKVLCEFIEEKYKLKTYTYKEFKDNPEKAVKIKNKEEVANILVKSMEKFRARGVTITVDIDKKKFVKSLEKFDKDQLIILCKNKGIQADDDDKKSKLIKRLTKKAFKE